MSFQNPAFFLARQPFKYFPQMLAQPLIQGSSPTFDDGRAENAAPDAHSCGGLRRAENAYILLN
jgi:hypothetical protein